MRRVRAIPWLVAILVAGACISDEQTSPRPRPDSVPSTTELDTSGVELAGVPGQTTTTFIETGATVIAGSVTGPKGLVVGATVRVERLVAGREIRTDLVTGDDGAFRLEGLPGGRYRVRAFLAPSLVQVVPDVRFLSDDEEHTFDLVVEHLAGVAVQAGAAPDPPLLGRPVNIVVAVVNRTVDGEGIVRSSPVVGLTVELVGLGRWVLREAAREAPEDDPDDDETTSSTSPFETTTSTTQSAPPSAFARTGSTGRVRYELRCEVQGSPGLALSVPVTRTSGPDDTTPPETTTQRVPLDLPACVDPTTLTTTSTSPPRTSTTKAR